MTQHDVTVPGCRNAPGGSSRTAVTAIPSRLQVKYAVTGENDGLAFAREATADRADPSPTLGPVTRRRPDVDPPVVNGSGHPLLGEQPSSIVTLADDARR
ncbi:hypothetical protein [Streptomyces sp. NPDC096153]|uniref:hypothetical protein n=1 Tax=Streptomyces sp. NPDC096153 TaxID=3155548 RepID=UPI003330673D